MEGSLSRSQRNTAVIFTSLPVGLDIQPWPSSEIMPDSVMTLTLVQKWVDGVPSTASDLYVLRTDTVRCVSIHHT